LALTIYTDVEHITRVTKTITLDATSRQQQQQKPIQALALAIGRVRGYIQTDLIRYEIGWDEMGWFG